jgi:RB1-inducible coiled-coil protein 1
LEAEEREELERTIKKCSLLNNALSEKEKENQDLRDSMASLTEQQKSQEEAVSKEIAVLKQEIEKLNLDHDESVVEIQLRGETLANETKEKLLEEKENELRALREKHKAELEGLRSRYKLMSSFDQRSPSDIQEKSFDSLERIPRTDDLLAELAKVADLSQKNPNDGIINQMIKGIITRLEGSAVGTIPQSPEKGSTSPAILRARAGASEEGPSSRASIEAEEEPAIGNVKSVYGLDTSAIDATAMCNSSDDPETMSQELSEILIPSSDIVNMANNFAKAGRITIQSCKAGDNVFIYFNDKLKAYLVYLSNKNVYFLHTDCLKMLDHSQDSPVKGFLAQVTEREFCVARRANNRYRVPQGFHFHRIRVKVLQIISDSSSK